jgi:hypothetical protein
MGLTRGASESVVQSKAYPQEGEGKSKQSGGDDSKLVLAGGSWHYMLKKSSPCVSGVGRGENQGVL